MENAEVVQNQGSGQNPQENPQDQLVNESFVAQLTQIIGGGQSAYTPTQAQVDKILDLQEKGMDYTHSERTTVLPRQKIQIIIFCVVVGVLLAIFILCLFFAKEYLGEVVTGIFGFVGGGAGGYGFAKMNADNNGQVTE